MKKSIKILSLILALCVIFVCASCANNNDTSTTTTTTQDPQPVQADYSKIRPCQNTIFPDAVKEIKNDDDLKLALRQAAESDGRDGDFHLVKIHITATPQCEVTEEDLENAFSHYVIKDVSPERTVFYFSLSYNSTDTALIEAIKALSAENGVTEIAIWLEPYVPTVPG